MLQELARTCLDSHVSQVVTSSKEVVLPVGALLDRGCRCVAGCEGSQRVWLVVFERHAVALTVPVCGHPFVPGGSSC